METKEFEELILIKNLCDIDSTNKSIKKDFEIAYANFKLKNPNIPTEKINKKLNEKTDPFIKFYNK